MKISSTALLLAIPALASAFAFPQLKVGEGDQACILEKCGPLAEIMNGCDQANTDGEAMACMCNPDLNFIAAVHE